MTSNKRMMWSRMTLAELLQTPSAGAWGELKKRMGRMDPAGTPASLAEIERIAAAVKGWPRHVSRPPDPRWRRPDPRLHACLVIDEEVTYKPIYAALCAAFRLSTGETAVFLRRRWVGGALDMSGQNMISVNETGEADMSGWLILEHPSGARLPVYYAVEGKMDGGSESEDQEKERARILAAGGIAIVVVGKEDAIRQTREHRDRLVEIWKAKP